MRATDAVGDYGERVAQRFLTEQGMTVLCRGWRCGQGEIDIVAVDGSCLVVCEVKTRRSVLAGTPLDAVTPEKLARLRRLAAAWLADHGGGYAEGRIDAVRVLVPRRRGPPGGQRPGAG